MKVELEPKQKIIIGQDLGVIAVAELISHFSCNINVFAWKVEDMPGINPKVAVHKLNINSKAIPIKQRKRSFVPERQEVI